MSLTDARHYMRISSPRTPQVHLIESALGGHLFVADGSRLFDADASLFASYRQAIEGGTEAIDGLLREAGLVARPFIDDTPLAPPPLRALSLAIAQKCNLGCTYCYAQQGEFGGAAKNMEPTEALRAGRFDGQEKAQPAWLPGPPGASGLRERATLCPSLG